VDASIVKESSIKISVSTLALLGLVSIAATPTLAKTTPVNEQPSQLTNELSTASSGQDLPFFARFLEGQREEIADNKVALTDRDSRRERGDRLNVTRKYPSDNEDINSGGSVTTKKYPSDNEDSTGGGVVTTKKYPSDNEDINSGGGLVTQKFPSDGEDNTGINPPIQRR
jgi:Serine endopeptidase inhibitors